MWNVAEIAPDAFSRAIEFKQERGTGYHSFSEGFK
jgi:hypothetical protein